VVGAGDATVSTVEHLLAALSGLGIWDAALALEGPEVPILDGSALPFVEALAHLRPTQVKPLKLTRSISIEGGGGRALAEPSEDFAIACSVRFDHPAIGEQHAAWDGSRERFIRELAPARTFGFVEEVATLRQRSLIAGGSLDCALVYGPEGSVNTPRFSDEVVRHKLLDAVGDLALIGRPLLARITLERPGHGLTTALTRAIKQV
jgi:UDP-3-O-[3-hydroxymyristoyl] N-acetylglucosamine deacetylase